MRWSPPCTAGGQDPLEGTVCPPIPTTSLLDAEKTQWSANCWGFNPDGALLRGHSLKRQGRSQADAEFLKEELSATSPWPSEGRCLPAKL